MSLLSPPPELIRLIAKNLCAYDLFRFQQSSRVLLATTFDVSFCCNYFKEAYSKQAISFVYFLRNYIPNWNPMAERLNDDIDLYVHYFFTKVYGKFNNPEEHVSHMTGRKVERIGYEMGEIFNELYEVFCFANPSASLCLMATKNLELRVRRPELAETKYWHYFEDLFFCEFRLILHKDELKIRNINDPQIWCNVLSFSCKTDYRLFQQEILKHILISTIKNVSNGLMNCDRVIELLENLIPWLQNVEDIARNCCVVYLAIAERLPDLAKVYEFMLKEIIGKRQRNYDLFFERFLERLIQYIPLVAEKKDV
ncbi:hypothetical protein MP638_001694 [Amoeboaphelidium occidentale]|nr:hypothetical protein MP638_001694 [Amoeboaphelidium occidentale]